MKIIEIYEYGNGTYAEPFWDRVQKKIDKVEEEYEIINMNKKFIPSHYIGKNCMEMDVYRGDELFLTLYCKSRWKKCSILRKEIIIERIYTILQRW